MRGKYRYVEMQTQRGPDRPNKSRAGSARPGPDQELDRRTGSTKTGRLLEVYDPSLVDMHISRS